MLREARHDFAFELLGVEEDGLAFIERQRPMIVMRIANQSLTDAHEFLHFWSHIGFHRLTIIVKAARQAH
jgi:hypothetical protein